MKNKTIHLLNISMILSSTLLYANSDTLIPNIKKITDMNTILDNGTYKQKLFLALNPNITFKMVEELLLIGDSIISSTIKDNPIYNKYIQNKAFINNKRQQEIIKKRKTIKFQVKEFNKIKNLIKKYYKSNDLELKVYYNKQILDFINKYEVVFYKLDDLFINRFLAEANISKLTIDFLLGISNHKDDFILRKNILNNKNIVNKDFIKYFKDEDNSFLVFYLETRLKTNKVNNKSQNLGNNNKINILNEDITNTNVILGL